MDDEEFVRSMASEMLKKLGYDVELATHGEEALNIYRKEKETGRGFNAVIMDLTVPGGKGGRETIQEMMAFDPAVRGIVSSGYSNDPIMANFRQYGFRGCVAKPYRIQDISKVLNQVLQS
ncbi:MAG: response regulator [Nitrospirae bacterium]|nr:response regulator [Nitrospirota bacterium]